MTKDEFRPIVRKLRIAYRRDKFFDEDDMIDLWYERLGKADKDILMAAADKYIDNHTFQPTIADIITEYKKITDHASEVKAQLREIYDRTKGTYPDTYLNSDAETKEAARKRAIAAWWAMIKDLPLDKRLDKAHEIENEVMQYVRQVEADTGRQQIPTLEEFFRGAR